MLAVRSARSHLLLRYPNLKLATDTAIGRLGLFSRGSRFLRARLPELKRRLSLHRWKRVVLLRQTLEARSQLDSALFMRYARLLRA